MLKSVEYATRARNHLKQIKTYIAQDNEAAALRVVTYITDEADGLLEYPLMGKPWSRAGTRKLVLQKYTYSILYKITASKIVILAVVHQALKKQT